MNIKGEVIAHWHQTTLYFLHSGPCWRLLLQYNAFRLQGDNFFFFSITFAAARLDTRIIQRGLSGEFKAEYWTNFSLTDANLDQMRVKVQQRTKRT